MHQQLRRAHVGIYTCIGISKGFLIHIYAWSTLVFPIVKLDLQINKFNRLGDKRKFMREKGQPVKSKSFINKDRL